MHAAALRALEFDRIVDAVRAFSLTPMGAERLAALEPSTDHGVVAELLASTTQAAQYIAKHGSFALRAHADLPEILGALAVEGRALEAPRLLALATFLDSVEDTKTAIRRVADTFPLVDKAAANAASFGLLWAYRHGDANMRSAWICTRNDVLGNLAVLLAALGVFGTGTGWPDVAVAAIMSALALQGATIVARQSLAELRQPITVPAE